MAGQEDKKKSSKKTLYIFVGVMVALLILGLGVTWVERDQLSDIFEENLSFFDDEEDDDIDEDEEEIDDEDGEDQEERVVSEVNYNPSINPSDFTIDITNPHFNLPVGRKLVYEGETAEGLERIEIEIINETKEIMGVETIVYWDRVWLDGELIEETKDYLAQDKEGNVWYFGEEVDNYENGKLLDHDGAWIAGKNGAEPGIWIKSNHKVGDTYRQEYLMGEAEDMRDVISTNETITIAMGTYENCIQMYDWTPLDPESKEYKYYCPDLGAMVLEVNVDTKERVELIEVN